jgi:Ca2+-binding RTX toxin-like protein
MRRIIGAAVAASILGAAPAAATSTPQPLPYEQRWTNTSQISVDDDWSSVPGVIGYRGDAVTSSTPLTATLGDVNTVVDVDAQSTVVSSSGASSTGGVAELELADPVVAFQGSGTADYPNLVFHLDTTGVANVVFSARLRDVDHFSSANQEIAIQYRVGATGDYTNLYYLVDATAPGNTMETNVWIPLPADAGNQPLLQIRAIGRDASGTDEFIGVDDVLVSATPSCTKLGTAGDDIIQGTAGPDVICGLGGNDKLTGLGGDDILFGGEGKDSLAGGTGNDVLDGGAGVDVASFYDLGISGVTVALAAGTAGGGGAGKDIIVRTAGVSTVENIQGSPGDDVIIGDGSVNALDGRQGNDAIYGAGGNDNVIGNVGDDYLAGNADDDTLLGGAGADQLYGDDGKDKLTPGLGDDLLDGGGGASDMLDYNEAAVTFVHVDLSAGTSTGSGTDTIALSTVENVTGTLGDDEIYGDAGANYLSGLAGNDLLVGGDGPDTLIGLGGNDQHDGGDGNDLAQPGEGADIVIGGDTGESGFGDQLKYNDALSAVTVTLPNGPTAGGAEGDTIAGFESMSGSAFDDVLSAPISGVASLVNGTKGADTIDVTDGDALDSANGGTELDTCQADGGDLLTACEA